MGAGLDGPQPHPEWRVVSNDALALDDMRKRHPMENLDRREPPQIRFAEAH